MYQCKISSKKRDHCKIFFKENNKGMEIALIPWPLQTLRHCKATFLQQLSSKREKLRKAITDRVKTTKGTGQKRSDGGKRPKTEESKSQPAKKDILVNGERKKKSYYIMWRWRTYMIKKKISFPTRITQKVSVHRNHKPRLLLLKLWQYTRYTWNLFWRAEYKNSKYIY